jgi:hypothetical protein
MVKVFIWYPDKSKGNQYGHASIYLGGYFRFNEYADYNPGYVSFWPGEAGKKIGKKNTSSKGAYYPKSIEEDKGLMGNVTPYSFAFEKLSESLINSKWESIISQRYEYSISSMNCCDVVGLCLSYGNLNTSDSKHYKNFIKGLSFVFQIPYPSDIVEYCRYLKRSE